MSDQGHPLGLTHRALDALPVNVAILDAEGRIVWTDQAWRRFATENDIDGPPDTIGANYLAVSRDTDELGDAAAAGIEAVLAGDRRTFTLEYPCHSPDEKRWFLMWAGAFGEGDERFAAVAHFDVTDRVEAEREVEAADDRIYLTVSDDGSGIPPEQRRSVSGREEKGLESPGSGIGLYLVDRLVDAYGGEVWIEDSTLGGTVFTVVLQRPD